MNHRKEYFAEYYQRNKVKMDAQTVAYYKSRGKEFKKSENLKYKMKSILSKREAEILKLTETLRSREIANVLNISQRTVDAHKSNLMGKLGVKNMVQAMLAYRNRNKKRKELSDGQLIEMIQDRGYTVTKNK